MMKMLDKAMRTDLIKMLRTSDEAEHNDFADELEAAGQYTEATEDEIERFMEII